MVREKRVLVLKKTPENRVNFVLAAIFVIIVLQSLMMIYLSYNILYVFPQNINITKYQLDKKIDMNNAEIESKIGELSKSLIETKNSLGKEISSIKADTSADFSGIIQSAVKSVVSIRTDVAQGTGFIITSNGHVVTNAHVLSGASYADAVMSDQSTKEMSLIGYNTIMDIALLKINGNFDYLDFRDSDNIQVGEKVIAIGNPLGLGFSVSEGIVSAVNRQGSNGYNAYIQTDAALNPGNSGGPLIGTDGKVIGINNFKARGESIGFALESNYIKESVNEISLKGLNMTILS